MIGDLERLLNAIAPWRKRPMNSMELMPTNEFVPTVGVPANKTYNQIKKEIKKTVDKKTKKK